MTIRLSMISALGAVACSQYHVALTPPSPTITPDQRVAMFHAMKPASALGLQTSTDGGRTWELTNSTVVLANQQEVVSPEDLAPLVSPTSDTMRAARRSVAARRKRNIAWVFTGAGIASAALVGGFSDRLGNASTGLVVLGTSLLGFAVVRLYQRVELAERQAAFRSYTRDLGMYLDVCARGLEVVPCEPRLPTGRVTMHIPR